MRVFGHETFVLVPHSNDRDQPAMTKPNETFDVARTDEQWQETLSPKQYDVLRCHGTEMRGTSPLNKEKRDGHVHVRRLRPALFSSDTKFESGTGWPSFYAPLDDAVGTTTDRARTACRAPKCTAALRRPPRPRVRRRPDADRAALLHERRRAEVRAEGVSEADTAKSRSFERPMFDRVAG